MQKDAIIINNKDNVATALRDIRADEKAAAADPDGGIREIVVAEPIPYGHKFALKNIPAGSRIIKYGEVIGRATRPIGRGRHAHVQNIESLRGRGDLE
ncbi:MAG: UxaA family hydrolase [Thermodesulfobacteriota bacterium]